MQVGQLKEEILRDLSIKIETEFGLGCRQYDNELIFGIPRSHQFLLDVKHDKIRLVHNYSAMQTIMPLDPTWYEFSMANPKLESLILASINKHLNDKSIGI